MEGAEHHGIQQGWPTTKMENYREIFAIYLSITSLFHSFQHLPCFPEVPYVMLLLICYMLQL